MKLRIKPIAKEIHTSPQNVWKIRARENNSRYEERKKEQKKKKKKKEGGRERKEKELETI